MKLLKKITKPVKCYEILSLDEDNRTFKTEDDIKWLLSEYEKQKEEKEMLIKQSEFKTRVAEAMEECKHENVEEKFKSV